jgi:hypothetical protein
MQRVRALVQPQARCPSFPRQPMRTSKAINEALKRRGINNHGIMHIKSRKGRICMREWKEDGEILPLVHSCAYAKDVPLDIGKGGSP